MFADFAMRAEVCSSPCRVSTEIEVEDARSCWGKLTYLKDGNWRTHHRFRQDKFAAKVGSDDLVDS